MRDVCKHRWCQKGGQYQDIVLNGLNWRCWMPLITLYIFESFRVFLSNDTLRIHLLFSRFQIYSEYIFKGYSTLTFIVWAQIYVPWNTWLCNFHFCVSGLSVECVWICLFVYSLLLSHRRHAQAATCFKGCSWQEGHRNFSLKQRILDEKLWIK